MNAPERVETARLLLRRPQTHDAEAIFARYASDPEVIRYLSWPAHRSLEHTRAFLHASDAEWEQWPAGPYLIESRSDLRLLGATGLSFTTPEIAVTGYVLARDAWGYGYATEALNAVIAVARNVGVRSLYASCHAAHRASAHVLEKCGFTLESVLPAHSEFPNLGTGHPEDTLRYVRTFH